MTRKKSIPHRNQNRTGWWIFAEVEQWVSRRQKELKPGSKCLVWENMRLVQASNREEAYRKALKLCNYVKPMNTPDGEWRFAGISMLLPICEELEDGAEILWTDHGQMTAANLQKLVKAKKDLPVFDDSAVEE